MIFSLLGTTQGEQRTDLSMWPPPKPPSGIDVSQLPTDLRPSKYAKDESRYEKEFEKADAEGQTVGGQVKEQMKHEAEIGNKNKKEPVAGDQTSTPSNDGDVQMERTTEVKHPSGVEFADAKEPSQILSAGNTGEAVADGCEASSADNTNSQQPEVKHRVVQYSKHSASTHYFIRRQPIGKVNRE